MYRIGQRVMYGIHGVCQIVDITVRSVGREKVQCYVLEPADHPETRYYIPSEKPAAVAKIRPVLTRQELDALLREELNPEAVWIPDENQRKNKYRELLVGGDHRAVLAMLQALAEHKKKQEDSGRKFHLCDENFLRDAQKLLASEFCLVLEMSLQDTARYIMAAIN